MENLIVIGLFWHSVNKCVNILSLKCNMRVLFDNKRNNIQSALHYCKTQDLLRSILPLCTVRTGLYPLVNTKGQITSMTLKTLLLKSAKKHKNMCFSEHLFLSECNWHSGWVMLSEIKLHARSRGYIYLLLVNTKGVAFRMLRTLARLCSWPSLAGSSPPPEPENGQYPLPLDPLPPIMGRRTFSSWSGHTWDRRTALEDKRT